ncbi:MAG: O-antigen ligase family protein [Planctomycetota bacterium]
MRQISFVFLWLLILIVPWEERSTIPGLASFAKILGLVVFLLGLTTVLVSGRVKFPFALVWLTLFAGWCAASTLWAINPGMALHRVHTYVLLLAFVWLISTQTDNPKRLKAIIRAFVLGTAVMVINQYLGFFHAGVDLNTEESARFTAFATDANLFACTCSMGILFAFYLITRLERTGFELPNWFYWGFIVAFGIAVLLSGSRAGVLSGGIAGFVLLGRLRKITWAVRLGFVVAVMFVAFLAPRLVARSTFDRIGEGTSSHTFELRTNAWLYGMKAWTETPILGVGAGGYFDAMAKQGQKRMVAHNTFISVLVETGLVGFVFYFSFWAIVIRRILLLPKADRFFWFGLFASFLPALLSLSAEYLKVWWFLGGLVLCQMPQPSASDAKKRRIAGAVVPGLPLPTLTLRPDRP